VLYRTTRSPRRNGGRCGYASRLRCVSIGTTTRFRIRTSNVRGWSAPRSPPCAASMPESSSPRIPAASIRGANRGTGPHRGLGRAQTRRAHAAGARRTTRCRPQQPGTLPQSRGTRDPVAVPDARVVAALAVSWRPGTRRSDRGGTGPRCPQSPRGAPVSRSPATGSAATASHRGPPARRSTAPRTAAAHAEPGPLGGLDRGGT
jgi:hypothetical protein